MKSKAKRRIQILLKTALLLLLSTKTASAYIGPGAGLSAIGSLLAIIAAVIVGVVGFLWYPIKRLRRRKVAVPESDDDPRQMTVTKSKSEGDLRQENTTVEDE